MTPLLSNVRLQLDGDRLSVTGTDDELTIHIDTTVAGNQDGTLVAPSRLTTDIVRSLEPGAVDVVAEGEEARISSGRSNFTVRTRSPEDFPRLGTPVPEGAQLPGSVLGDAIRQVVGAAEQGSEPAGAYRRVALRGGRRTAPRRYRLVPPGHA